MNNSVSPAPEQSHIASLAYAYQGPVASARLRSSVDDFQVRENLSFQPSGNGNHVYLYIQKRLLNTEDLCKKIAKLANVAPRDIGYAGLKDRNAVTCQWFSVDMSGKAQPDWEKLESDRIKVLTITRHERKLKHGSVSSNAFQLILRDVQGDTDQLSERLSLVKSRGVPNYFAEQRFGIDENNLTAAQQMFTGQRKVKNRHLRGLYFSVARSYLYNLILSHRVTLNAWDQVMAGDAMILEGSRSFFVVEQVDEEIVRRLQQGDIHPSGPLWGKGELATQGEARDVELEALQDCFAWQQALQDHGLEQQRRALRLLIGDLYWEFNDPGVLQLTFTLPSGAYATSVVRELVNVT